MQKSSSASVLSSSPKQLRNISAPGGEDPKRNLTLDIDLANQELKEEAASPEVRMRRLHKVKEEFLRTPVSAPVFFSEVQYPERNRLE